MKEFIKKLIPPIAYDIKKKLSINNYLYYFNEYDVWDDALKESQRLWGDYETPSILDQVNVATQKVRSGEARYEQDGVCYYEENNNWELLAAILFVRSHITDRMSVLDWGALGSTFFRYKSIIEGAGIEWCVVEQKHYVEIGKQEVPEVDFFYTTEEAVLSERKPNTLLLSGVLMYLDEPFKWLLRMLEGEFGYIIIDETAFLLDEDAHDKIVLQHVPERIYSAVYPAHLFGLNSFKKWIGDNGYEIVWEWVYRGGAIQIKTRKGMRNTIDKGFLLKKRE